MNQSANTTNKQTNKHNKQTKRKKKTRKEFSKWADDKTNETKTKIGDKKFEVFFCFKF